MTGRVVGKVALVTGGANGIGRACALRLVSEGAKLVFGDIDRARGQALAREVEDAGGDALYVHLDVTDEASWRAAIAEIERRFERLDILVNNAGVGVRSPSIADFPLHLWRKQQAVNVEGVFLGIKHCLPLMRRSQGGSIVNMSSIGGLVGSGMMSAYGATKGAVRLLSKSVALECAQRRDNIRVNSVHPGLVYTDIWNSFAEGDHGDTQTFTHDDIAAVAAATVPLGILGLPEDVAAGVLFLASDEARYITGAELVIDGGYSAR